MAATKSGMMISNSRVKRRRVGTNTASTSSEKRRDSASPSSPCSRWLNRGTKPAEKAPSPNSRRNVLGKRKATKKASAAALAPITRAISISRAKPATRLTMVRPPIVPVAFQRFIRGAPPGAGARSGLADLAGGRAAQLLLSPRDVERVEVDRFEHQRREAALLHRLRDDVAGEGEEDARRLGEQKRLEVPVFDIADADQAGIHE